MAVFEKRPEKLLSRGAFKEVVFGASHGLCVFCTQPAVDAHHILDRKLFKDGGYYLSNGAAVCEKHHWDCEKSVLSVDAVRAAAHCKQKIVPDGFSLEATYDKWGVQSRED